MAATTPRITFIDVDIAGFMHALQVEPQLFALNANRPFDAHQAAGVVFPLTHAGEVEQNSVERHRKVSAAFFHDRGLTDHLNEPGVRRELVDDLPQWFGEEDDAEDEGQPEDEEHVGFPRASGRKRGELERTDGHAASRRHKQLALQPSG